MNTKKGHSKGSGVHGSLQEQRLSQGLSSPDQVPETREACGAPYTQEHEMFSLDQTRLPKDTREVLRNTAPDNFALKLNRRVFFQEEKQKCKPVLFRNTKDGVQYSISFTFESKGVKDISDRQLFAIQDLGLDFSVMELSIDWRLIVGLGNESVYETSMTLHHVYGFPFIPASAVKGVVRSWVITELFGEQMNEDGQCSMDLKYAEDRALKAACFQDMFGDTTVAGKVRFFDALPVSGPKIDTDIMNPHYGDYYGDQTGRIPPADYLTPVPLTFLTVRDTRYRFVIGIRKADNLVMHDKICQGVSRLDAARMWLEKALRGHGIGAKTGVGYGQMSPPQ